MIHSHSLTYTTATAALILSLSASAFAKPAGAPQSTQQLSHLQAQAWSNLAVSLSKMNQRELRNQFLVRNAKGDIRSKKEAEPAPTSEIWSQKDPVENKIEGTSTEKLYKEFSVTAHTDEVLVAVIDDGVDITHPDLQGKIWVNSGEIPGDGIDNDGDGYIDDVNGWNFLGGKDSNGNNVNVGGTNLELTREVARLTKKKATAGLTAEEEIYFTKVKTQFESEVGKIHKQADFLQNLLLAIDVLKKNGLTEESVEAVDSMTATSEIIEAAKELVRPIFKDHYTSEDVQEALGPLQNKLDFNYNLEFNSSAIVKDNPEVLDEKGYGNNDVIGPDANHGTHVSGIIAALRANGFGIDGQALNVKIMALRAVPDGDERDKDVANAIRFAADHHARVINMSFGKEYSPNKPYVDAAVRYAESKGVLLVHAAGNDGKETETLSNNFPNRNLTDVKGGERLASNWIEVGASSLHRGLDLPATFSNWGKSSVDLFAPGVNIESTVMNKQYDTYSGTSMASPEVAGVAALLIDQFPALNPSEVRTTLMSTATLYPGVKVNQPHPDKDSAGKKIAEKEVDFADLSASGGVVNAYDALAYLRTSQSKPTLKSKIWRFFK